MGVWDGTSHPRFLLPLSEFLPSPSALTGPPASCGGFLMAQRESLRLSGLTSPLGETQLERPAAGLRAWV